MGAVASAVGGADRVGWALRVCRFAPDMAKLWHRAGDSQSCSSIPPSSSPPPSTPHTDPASRHTPLTMKHCCLPYSKGVGNQQPEPRQTRQLAATGDATAQAITATMATTPHRDPSGILIVILLSNSFFVGPAADVSLFFFFFVKLPWPRIPRLGCAAAWDEGKGLSTAGSLAVICGGGF